MGSSSKSFVVNRGEECESSESGWTMYIGSSIHDGSDANNAKKNCYSYEDDESDDSMASDASSGPSNQGMTHHFKLQQEEETKNVGSKYGMEKKGRKEDEDKEEYQRIFLGIRRGNDDDDDDDSKYAAAAGAAAQSGSKKVRKGISSWMGSSKRK